ncbi:hypothetical protein BaRGS_00039124 [Batillaria attramentaria]|uniref:Uncharacterized protein n=1 Tax=Batillaria attramentaria TaxID=370345 RepID=A0ABD0J4W1_9CAEN
MLQPQQFMLFGFVAIFSLSVCAVQHGDVHLSCERFKEGRPSHCNCTINKTEADSEKCSRSHPVQTVTIDKTGDGVSTLLCHFSNYTTGTLHRSHPLVDCSLHSILRNEVYILKLETIANRSRDEGAQINCNVSCVNAKYEYGLTTSTEGVPIQFACTPYAGAIAGGVIAGLVAIGIVVALVYFVRRQDKR